jgi:hypothetical protein
VTDIYPPKVQREALLKLVEALGCRDSALRRDECGDWTVKGRYGDIYAAPGTTAHGLPPGEGFQIYFRGAEEFGEPLSSKGWTYERALLFCKVTQDGDDEGMLSLDRLPTEMEAALIRDKLGIPKKREIGEAELERLRAMGAEYGLPTGPHRDYEVDHLIPLCLGGSDADSNLWPEPRRSIEKDFPAELKDDLEHRLCQMVCNGELDVRKAQPEIASDWVETYHRRFRRGAQRNEGRRRVDLYRTLRKRGAPKVFRIFES